MSVIFGGIKEMAVGTILTDIGKRSPSFGKLHFKVRYGLFA